jgi:hypothetical protein
VARPGHPGTGRATQPIGDIVPDIYAALSAVMGDVQSIAKGTGKDVNRKQNYVFRGIDTVVDAVGPVLRKHKVMVIPNVRSFDYGEITTGKDRTPMGHARVVVEYTFYAPDGTCILSSAAGEAFDSGDKATPKAMSVAYRTALLQALCVPTGDPEPDAESYERSPQPSPAEVAQAAADLAAMQARATELNAVMKEVAAAAVEAGLSKEETAEEFRIFTNGKTSKEVTDPDEWRSFLQHLKSIPPVPEGGEQL